MKTWLGPGFDWLGQSLKWGAGPCIIGGETPKLTLFNGARIEHFEHGLAFYMKTTKVSATEFIDALPGTGGVKSTLAKKLGVSRNSIDAYLRRYPSAKKAWEDERLRIRDLADGKLIEKIDGGHWPAIQFALTHVQDSGRIEPPVQKSEMGVTTRDAPKSRIQRITEAENRFDKMEDAELNELIKKLVVRNSPELVADGKVIVPQVGVWPWGKYTEVENGNK